LACITPSNFCTNSLFIKYTNIAFLICELFLISKIKLRALVENQLDIKGTSDKLKSILEKYQSPLNNTLFFIHFTIVGWLELINLAKVVTEGKITCNTL
jgi:hypothetical protein